MTGNNIATLRTVANTLEEMSKSFYQSGMVGYSFSMKSMSETINEVVEAIQSELERLRMESYLKAREEGLTLW